MQLRTFGCAAVTALALLAGGQQAKGTLLFYEGFNYTLEEDLGGQTFSGIGGTGGWEVVTRRAEITNGLSFGSLVTSGNAVLAFPDHINVAPEQWNGTGTQTVGSTFQVTGDTLWTSYLFQDFGDGSQGRTALRTDTGLRTYTQNEFFTSGDPGFWTNQPGLGLQTTDTFVYTDEAELSDGRVYLILTRFDNITADATGTVNATAWALDEDDFAALVASGWNPATLDTNFQQRITQDTTGPISLAISDVRVLFNRTNGIVDELRFGTTLQSVTPIPEPASVALLGLTGLVLFRRSRRAG